MLTIYKYIATIALVLGSFIIANAGDLNKSTHEDAKSTANAELTAEVTADPEVFYWYDAETGDILNLGVALPTSMNGCDGGINYPCAFGYEHPTTDPSELTADKIERKNF